MWVTNEVLKSIDAATTLSGNKIFLTDLENVLYVGNANSSDITNVPISRQLLQKFLKFSFTDIESEFYLIKEHKNVIPIYQEEYLNNDWASQIILPIFIDDSIYGSLISVNYYKQFNDKHLEFAKTTQSIIKGHILDLLNKEGSEINEKK